MNCSIRKFAKKLGYMGLDRPSYPSCGSREGRPQAGRSPPQPPACPWRFFVTAFLAAEKARSADASGVAAHRELANVTLYKVGHMQCVLACRATTLVCACLPCDHTQCACLACPGVSSGVRGISLSTTAQFGAPSTCFRSAKLFIAYSVTFVCSLAGAVLRLS